MNDILIISIDKILAREQIKKFIEYCSSTEMTDQMALINSILAKSSGETKEKLDLINNELTLIINTFMELMKNTKDFISNATDMIEDVDKTIAEILAEKIINNFQLISGNLQ